jgi:hypothetical protein
MWVGMKIKKVEGVDMDFKEGWSTSNIGGGLMFILFKDGWILDRLLW